MNDDLILLVDDEPGILKVLGISLADAGYRVATAADGAGALARFREIAYPPIVLTDIKMPGLDGIDLLKAIKAENPDTEVIMMTGHGDMDLAVRSLKFEATDFVAKPVSDEALEIALKRARERIGMRRRIREYTWDLERLVEEKTRELIDAERLAAVGQTVAGLSHAIKNIASGLEGGAFVLEKGLELDDREYLNQGWEMVRDNVARIKDLSLDLLGFAKPAVLRLSPTDPNQPAREVMALMNAAAVGLGVELVLETDPDDRPVSIDPSGLHRCLVNLVTNALDACADDACRRTDKRVRLTVRRHPGAKVEWAVEDNCLGMDPEVQSSLFKRFFTTKGSRGTGLGLMLTRKIVEAHGGTIEVTSEMGKGTRFSICLD